MCLLNDLRFYNEIWFRGCPSLLSDDIFWHKRTGVCWQALWHCVSHEPSTSDYTRTKPRLITRHTCRLDCGVWMIEATTDASTTRRERPAVAIGAENAKPHVTSPHGTLSFLYVSYSDYVCAVNNLTSQSVALESFY